MQVCISLPITPTRRWPQVNVNRDMNSLAFTLYTTFDHGYITKPCCFDKVRLKAE